MNRDLRVIRLQIRLLRRELEDEFLRRSAVLQAELEDAALALHRGGMSVSAIAREYGTTNWKTVRDLLDRAEQRAGTPVKTAEVSPLPDEDGYPNPYRVVLSTGDVVDVYVPEPGNVRVLATPDVQHTYDLLDKTGPVWAALVRAGVVADPPLP